MSEQTITYQGPERVFSGVQPTGNLHLGNYLGAIKRFVDLQHEYNCLYCVVDLHAITVWQDPRELRSSTREVAAAFIAAGVDPERSIIFNQSAVSAHAELAWIFNCVARMGWLNRMTQFKDKAGKDKENASVGLFAYPNLMAADILAYKATHVPVGDDQKQHLELSRDIAQKFNNDFDAPGFFPLPEPLIAGPATRVMSLRDGSAKMSKSEKSDHSRINLSDDADAIAKKFKKAKSDPDLLPASVDGLRERPEAENLLGIFAALSDRAIEDVVEQFAGQQFSSLKNELTDLAISVLEPIRGEMDKLLADQDELDKVLASGAGRADEIAQPILSETKRIVGLI